MRGEAHAMRRKLSLTCTWWIKNICWYKGGWIDGSWMSILYQSREVRKENVLRGDRLRKQRWGGDRQYLQAPLALYYNEAIDWFIHCNANKTHHRYVQSIVYGARWLELFYRAILDHELRSPVPYFVKSLDMWFTVQDKTNISYSIWQLPKRRKNKIIGITIVRFYWSVAGISHFCATYQKQ